MDTPAGDPFATLSATLGDSLADNRAGSIDTGPAARPGPHAHARSALLLSLALHVLPVGLLIALEVRAPFNTTPHTTLQITLRPAASGQPGAVVPDTPLPAGPQPATPVTPSPPDEQTARTGMIPAAPAPTARQATPPPASEPVAAADTAPPSEGMALGYVEISREDYVGIINRWLRQQGIWYPPAARERGLEGRVLVNFSLDRQGRIVALRVSESSGQPLLDEAALETVRRAAPYPPPPDGLPFPVIEDIYLPVRFRLDR